MGEVGRGAGVGILRYCDGSKEIGRDIGRKGVVYRWV